ncbi:hypothetical protein CB1_000743110 [Camelus ferus]|nr:hypothetical protein CB1_000743110 [Camelus ferus]
MALAYCNYEDLPTGMENLHLEYFEEAVNYLLNHPQIKGPGVGLLGTSKGGELCLSMASFLKGITAAVIINGSVANTLGNLHYKGETLPPLGFNPKRIKVTKDGFADILEVLNSPLEGPNQKSLIPLERAESAFLFLVGQDDHNWKSEFFANETSKRLQAHGKEKPQIICYPGAGHYIEPPYFPMCPASLHTVVGGPVIWGGEPRAHATAQMDAWQQLQAFFHKHLGPGPFPGIIDIFGIGGGLLEYRASLLAGHGFATLALAYYDFEDLPKKFDTIHLDYFEEALCYMLQHTQVKGPGIGLLGISLGADICLSMASFLKNISATVSINGSALSGDKAIYYKENSIPPLGHDLRRMKVAFSGLLDIVDIRNDIVGGCKNPCMIPIEKAQGPILFIVGQDDHNWRSAGPFPGIIDLFGSGGGLCEYRASLLAGHGFVVLALAFFRFEDLPKYLNDVCLEYFEEAVDFMLQHPKVKGPSVGLLGFSKGGDLCLSMASFLKNITATVVINACVANTIAPLRYKDMIIPDLSNDTAKCKITESGFWSFVDIWNNPLEKPNHQSLIPLEKAQGPFLFIVGMDDQNWKSEFYAQLASERLQAHGKDRPEIIYYPGTGHCIGPPYFPLCRASVHAFLSQPVSYGARDLQKHSPSWAFLSSSFLQLFAEWRPRDHPRPDAEGHDENPPSEWRTPSTRRRGGRQCSSSRAPASVQVQSWFSRPSRAAFCSEPAACLAASCCPLVSEAFYADFQWIQETDLCN